MTRWIAALSVALAALLAWPLPGQAQPGGGARALPRPAAVSPGERVALVIGNGAYRHAPPLTNPPNDAADVTATLRGLGFEVVEGRDLDRAGMEEALRRFAAKIKGAKLTAVFYAGHGLQVDGRNYLVPVDAKIARAADLGTEAVSLDYVMIQLDAEPRVNLIFLDACRDNPLAAATDRALATREAAIGTGLAQVKGAIDTMIVFSTQPDNVALDGRGRNSPFTEALLRHMAAAGVEVGGVMRRVRTDVVEATKDQQVPQIPWDHSSLRSDVVLGPPAPATPPAPTTPAAPAIAAAPPSPAPTRPAPAPAALPPAPPPAPSGGVGSIASAIPGGAPATTAAPAGRSSPIGEAEALVAECDRLAADPFDIAKPDNVRGVQRAIISPAAVKVCANALVKDQANGRIHYQLGRALYAAKDYPKANVLFQSAIELGYAQGYAELGRQHFFGFGVPQSYAKARELFEKGAEAGDPSAIKNIGFMYHKGFGVKADIRRAISYYEKAPDHPTVINNMAVLYEAGEGVPKDAARAVRMFEQAALGGDEVAYRNLGDCYANGSGVKKDLAKARLLYGMAANLGDQASAQAFARLRPTR